MKTVDFKDILRYFNKNRFWEIAVSFSIILLIIIFIFNIYIFWVLEKDASSQIDSDFSIQSLRRDLLEKVLDNLKRREEVFNQNSAVKPDINDPSL